MFVFKLFDYVFVSTPAFSFLFFLIGLKKFILNICLYKCINMNLIIYILLKSIGGGFI